MYVSIEYLYCEGKSVSERWILQVCVYWCLECFSVKIEWSLECLVVIAVNYEHHKNVAQGVECLWELSCLKQF